MIYLCHLKNLLMILAVILCVPQLQAESYMPWQVTGDAIVQPLGGLRGDAERGRQIAINRSKGNCLACHQLPIPDEEFQGTVGPPLDGVGSRLNAGQIRLRIVDEKRINPMTIMPGFYRDPDQLHRVLDEYVGKTLLNAQEVEDVVAYLLMLRETHQ